MVASAVTGEGKTLTAANLALTLSESFQRRVLLVDADLRRPSLHLLFGTENVVGLNDGLKAERRREAAHDRDHAAVVAPDGRTPESRSDEQPDVEPDAPHHRRGGGALRLGRPRHARRSTLLPDANLLAEMADVVLFVVGAGTTPYHLVQRAVQAVDQKRIAGVVLNRVADSPAAVSVPPGRGRRAERVMIRMLASALTRRSVVLAPFEFAAIVATVYLSARLRFGVERAWLLFLFEDGLPKALFFAAVCQVCIYFADLYDLTTSHRRDLFIRIIQALGTTSIVLALVYFLMPRLVIGRDVVVIAVLLTISIMGGWRLAFDWFTRRAAPRERLLLIGTTPAAIALARELFERRAELGVDIVGFIDRDPSRVGEPVINPGVIGTIEDIPSIVARAGREPRRRQPRRRARPAADGHAARDAAGRRAVRSPRVGVRGIHRQDRRREPQAELAHLLVRIQEDAPAPGGEAHAGHHRRDRRPRPRRAARRAGRRRGQAHVARKRLLPPGARRAARPRVHGPQVPLDAPGRRGAHRGGVGVQGRRPAGDADRTVHPAHAHRRDPAALERPGRRHEPGRAAARAPRPSWSS